MPGRRLKFHVFIRIFGRTPVDRWEFQTPDPHQWFQITLGRMPEGCEYGAWSVNATVHATDPLVFDTEDEARVGYREEALRLQRLAGPGRWLHLDPY